MRVSSSSPPAPLAIATAAGLGQPSRGLTIRIRLSPKFHMARAAAPIFSPICGSTRIETRLASGPSSRHSGVILWSVPAIAYVRLSQRLVSSAPSGSGSRAAAGRSAALIRVSA